jgi:hypothetical protein
LDPLQSLIDIVKSIPAVMYPPQWRIWVNDDIWESAYVTLRLNAMNPRADEWFHSPCFTVRGVRVYPRSRKGRIG